MNLRPSIVISMACAIASCSSWPSCFASRNSLTKRSPKQTAFSTRLNLPERLANTRKVFRWRKAMNSGWKRKAA